MKIISAEERLKQQTGVKMAIFGGFGIGKTSLLKTLSEPTLCLDFEAGLLAVQDWLGDSISVRTWEDARDIACLIGGINPAANVIMIQLKQNLRIVIFRNTNAFLLIVSLLLQKFAWLGAKISLNRFRINQESLTLAPLMVCQLQK